jgi:plasmid stabilization system protein ParE
MRVEFSAEADADMERLAEFLGEKSERAAMEAVEAITSAVLSLAEFPERGVRHSDRLRQLVVRWGRDGYVIRYQVYPQAVVISRIYHGRENR